MSAHRRGLGLCLGVQGVSERLVGAPAATLRRLQDGGSPDNSGAAGKGLFTDFFFISPSSSVCTHVTITSFSHRRFFPYILSRWLSLGTTWSSKQPWPDRTLLSLLTPVWLTAVSMCVSMMACASSSSRDHLTGCVSRLLAPSITQLYMDRINVFTSLMLTSDTSLLIVCLTHAASSVFNGNVTVSHPAATCNLAAG